MRQYIRVIDLETTGFDPKDGAEVCEIGAVDVYTGHDSEINKVTPCILTGTMSGQLVKPEHGIPPQCSAIHHIIDSDVQFAKSWEQVSGGYLKRVSDESGFVDVFAAHNAKFERLFCTDDLTNGLPWICTYKCSLRVFPDSPSHSNQCLRYYNNYEGIDRELAKDTHRALPDAYVTAFHVIELLKHASVEKLIEWSSLPALQVTCHIGSWRGHKWSEVDEGFLHWILGKDFDEDVMYTVQHELQRREIERGQGRLDI